MKAVSFYVLEERSKIKLLMWLNNVNFVVNTYSARGESRAFEHAYMIEKVLETLGYEVTVETNVRSFLR